MKKNQSCNALRVLKIIRVILSIVLLSYTLSLCIIGHCASEQDYFPMAQNANGHFTEEWKTMFETQLDSENYNILVMYRYYQQALGRYHFYFVRYPKDADGAIYGEINNDLIHWSLYKYNHPATNAGSAYIQGDNLNLNYGGNAYEIFLNMESSNYNTDIDYISNFQLYSSNNVDTRRIVLMYSIGDDIPEGDSAREDMEKPQIGDYIPDWSNKPTFDVSSVENALQSVYNGIVWLGDNIKGTITGTGEYIADTVRWSIQKVLNTIRDVFSAITDKVNEVKNTILTVGDKIQATIDYISQPYDSTKVNTAFNNMSIKTDFNNMTTLVNNAFSVFDSTTEPNTFQIPIHLERIPILHVETVQYIDLGWLYDCRGLVRAFMWCITTFGLLYSIIDSLPNYLLGNDE